MNIPKFRAFHKKEQEVFEVLSIDFERDYVVLKFENGTFCSRFNEIKFMQSSRLRDKKGEEIFQGDIIKGRFYFRGVGAFDSGEGDYEVCDTVVFKNAKFTCRGFDLKDVVNGSVEVIGNIYKNPELIGGK